MRNAFWQTMREFEVEAAHFTRVNVASCSEMLELRIRSERLIAESRELLAKLDDPLARDPIKIDRRLDIKAAAVHDDTQRLSRRCRNVGPDQTPRD